MNKIKEYFAAKRVSNSLLGMLHNPFWVKYKLDNPDAEDDEAKHYRVGSALDCLLTDNDNFDDQFEVIDATRPYGLMAKFVDHLPKGLHPDSPLLSYVMAYEASGYKTKLEKIIEKFWDNEEFVNYYKLINASDLDSKSILSKDEYELVIALKSSLMASEHTSRYFTSLLPHVELIHQQPIYFEYRNTECKALMDGILIDHKEKIIQPFDLKTTHKNIYDFPEAFLQWGYYRQAAFYREALNTWLEHQNFVRDLSDYTIANFQFIVASKKTSGKFPPIIFECTENDLYCGMHGGYTHDGKYMRGINELIDAFHWHVNTNNWHVPKWIYDQKSKIILNTFKTNEHE